MDINDSLMRQPWDEFLKTPEKKILSQSVDQRVALFNDSMNYLDKNPTALMQSDEMACKFLRFALREGASDPRLTKIFNFLRNNNSPENKEINSLLNNLPGISSQGGEGLNLPFTQETLEQAIDSDQREIVYYLLQKGKFDLDILLNSGDTLLIWAINKGYNEIVKCLLDKGAKVEKENAEGFTPLQQAAWEGNDKAIRLLIDHHADLNKTTFDFSTALHFAAQQGREKAVKILIEAKADLDVLNDQGRTPLMEATLFKDRKIARMLINAGASLSASNDDTFPFYSLKITQLLPSHELRSLSSRALEHFAKMKEITRLKGVGHAYKFDGIVDVTAFPEISPTKVSVEGATSNYWIRKMAKATQLMKEHYGDLLPRKTQSLAEALTFSATADDSSNFENLLNAIKKGDPIFLPSYIGSHAVATLLWANPDKPDESYFVFCNRGAYNRGKGYVEVYKFNLEKLDIETLNLLAGPRTLEGDKELFELLPSRLDFKQSDLEKNLMRESLYKLLPQYVGNCSWESPETAVWAYFQLEELVKNPDQADFKSKIQTAHQRFGDWLVLNQIYQLERYVQMRCLRSPPESTPEVKERSLYQIQPKVVERTLKEMRLPSTLDPRIKEVYEQLCRKIKFEQALLK